MFSDARPRVTIVGVGVVVGGGSCGGGCRQEAHIVTHCPRCGFQHAMFTQLESTPF